MHVYAKISGFAAGVTKTSKTLLISKVCTALAITFSSTAFAQTLDPDTISLEKLQALADLSHGTEKLSEEKDLRSKALQEAAQSYGARAGMAHETSTIRRVLLKHANLWDNAFSFDHLMLLDTQKNELDPQLRARLIVSPVIEQSLDNTAQDSPDTIRTVDETVTIREQARFSLTKPSWRTYLLRDTASLTISPPHSSLLPKNDEEKAKFKTWVAEGWKAGVAQAQAIYHADLKKLDRDYQGMHLYMEMLEQGKVSAPFVASSNRGVTGDANTLNINDVNLKITVMPAFQLDTSKWTPVAQ